MPRLFVGTLLPHEEQLHLSGLKKANEDIEEKWQCRVRWVAPSKMHLTWLFIGHVEDEAVAEIKSTLSITVADWMKRSTNAAIELTYNKIEAWASEKRPRVMVATPEDVPETVYSLSDAIKDALLPLCPSDNVDRHESKFKPHITVARFQPVSKRHKHRVGSISLAQLKIADHIFPVEHGINAVTLFESLPDRNKDYQSLTEINLTPLP